MKKKMLSTLVLTLALVLVLLSNIAMADEHCAVLYSKDRKNDGCIELSSSAVAFPHHQER